MMEVYSGAKVIKAEVENKKGNPGYKVGYTGPEGIFDGPLEGGCHYISWSPKSVFEVAYVKGGMSQVSDGYHTFQELYDFRKTLQALLFNSWFDKGLYKVHKSIRHSDGEECFGGGWFIIMATTPYGQVSNHYEMKDWDLFKAAVRDKADEWDGHTAKDVLDRLGKMI